MTKFKVGPDVVLNIGGLLLNLVPELCKLFGKKRRVVNPAGWEPGLFGDEVTTFVQDLVPSATVSAVEIRKVAKLFETLGGKSDDGEGHYMGGTFQLIADALSHFKANGQAGPRADKHLQSAYEAMIKARDSIGRVASELFTVADVWGS